MPHIFTIAYLLCILLPASQQFVLNRTITITPDHPHIQYTGRWMFENDQAARAEWQGSAISVWAETEDVSAILDGGTETEYFRVVINGDASNTQKITVAPGKATYRIAENLPTGSNKIELIKETYNGQNTIFYGLSLDDMSRLLPPPAPPERFISFYGDSNLAGYSLESEHNERDYALRGSYFGLAGITARMFDASYHNISISGARISSLHEVFDQASRWDSTSKVDIASYTPDAIVINLGANDVGTAKEDIIQDYHHFLDTLRTIHPESHIVLFNAWGWDYNEPANFTHEVVAARDDPALSVSTFPWLFETWHGCEYDHAGMATVLANHLQDVLGWTQTPSDVMSGYGEHGDVANGGFEQKAPFGGYGWRYFQQEGTARIHNPDIALEGTYYVSLTNGAAIHQPNPAREGDQITVKLWMKGSSTQDVAKIKIDFRDQKMWTLPLQSDSLLVTLTPAWKQYEIQATASSDTERPVYHTRFTVGAEGLQSKVDVDGITMSIQTR